MRGSICPRGDSSKSNVSLPVQTPARLVSSEPHATRRIGFDAPIAELCSGPCESDLHSCGPTWALKNPPLLGSSSPLQNGTSFVGAPHLNLNTLPVVSGKKTPSCGVRKKKERNMAPQKTPFPWLPSRMDSRPSQSEPTRLTSRRSPGGSSPASRRGRWARAAAPPARPPLAPLCKLGLVEDPLIARKVKVLKSKDPTQ